MPRANEYLRPLIIAHRGDSENAPENTLAAFRLALEKGADGVEFDVQLSKDGVPVVVHDYTLERTGDRTESVADLTAKQLGKIDVGSWFALKKRLAVNREYSSQTVPTLVEVLDAVSDARGPIYIELKCRDENFGKLAKAVCEVVRESPLMSKLIVKSFKLGAVAVVKFALPEVRTAALFAPEIMNFLRRKRHMIALAREFGSDGISLHHSLATKGLTKFASEQNIPVTIWTADKAAWVERCRRRSIGALITNDPARQLAVRNRLS